MLDSNKIKEIIQHRYPFLLIDKVIEIEEGKRAVGMKNVTVNEPFFMGHFPEYPVMPGVLIVEALAQMSAVAMLMKAGNEGRLGLLAGINNCRFKHQVKPGDQLKLEIEITRVKGSIGKGRGIASVDGKVACDTELTFAFGK
ncbi:3-hydroxyacyl-ACP dehydratase FabZ [Metabacillus litoralis]|uniref:3-hydroxyacyl-ACP dehydratase FabZ n=1 Tax=Metabacillus TaxID=2675233 RepID=UPI000EF58969|nr:3-hydroxyacyl-ACP dehydratase FabZ [Metabacillus litoralis]MCM3163967.1 3-hydroxyacyl-ACP dehydratase FabZ [Metabacillus litoralis]MCM3410462.1 3-hydroxyacyl-ACP dehydratase FabZ [Metabacillus litoralis]